VAAGPLDLPDPYQRDLAYSRAGAALIVCNHVSYVDALLLMAVSPRPIRFVMDVSIFRLPVMSWLFRQVRAIPIASSRVDPAVMERAFEQVSEALRDGQLVCIFPEGGSRTTASCIRSVPA